MENLSIISILSVIITLLFSIIVCQCNLPDDKKINKEQYICLIQFVYHDELGNYKIANAHYISTTIDFKDVYNDIKSRIKFEFSIKKLKIIKNY